MYGASRFNGRKSIASWQRIRASEIDYDGCLTSTRKKTASVNTAEQTRPRRVAVGWWLAAIVLSSTVAHALLNLDQNEPAVYPDEIIYGELGRSLSDQGDLAIRGFAAHSYPPLYPAVLAPVYAIFDNLESAYRFILALNPLLMSAAAVPSYLLARRVATRGTALLAALLTVAVPSIAYTRFVMSESLFYLVFLVFLNALFLLLEDPTAKRQALLIVMLVVAGLTRFQAVALVPAVATAILLLAIFDGPRGGSAVVGRLRAYWLIWSAFAVGGVVVVAAQLARAKGLFAPPTSYGELRYDYGPIEVARWFSYHLAELEFYLGFVPFMTAAIVALQLTKACTERRMKILASMVLTLTFWVLLLAAAFASQSNVRYIEERYVFYLAPLFFATLVALIGNKARPTWRSSLTVVAACAVLPALVPLTSYTNKAWFHPSTLALRPLWRVQEVVGAGGLRGILLLVGALAAGLTLALYQRRTAVLIAVTLIFLIGMHAYVERTFHSPRWTGAEGRATTWVDDHVQVKAGVPVVWSGTTDVRQLFLAEFFNRSVGPVYNLGERFWLRDTPARITSRGLLTDRSGTLTSARYVIADRNLILAGRPVASDRVEPLTLYAVSGPVIVLGRVYGLLQSSTPLVRPNLGWSSSTFRFRRYACRGGAISLELLGNPFIGQRSQRVNLSGKDHRKAIRLRAGERRRWTIPLTRRGEVCDLRFHVTLLDSRGRRIRSDGRSALGVGVLDLQVLRRGP